MEIKTNKSEVSYLPDNENNYTSRIIGRPPSYNSILNDATLEKSIIKEKRRNLCKSIYSGFEDYCENSSLHGLKYIGDVSLTYFERFYWLVSFLTSVAFSAYFIASLYLKFNESPIIISFSPTPLTIENIPFPTVTICNINVLKKRWASDIARMYDGGLKTVYHACRSENADVVNATNMLHALQMGHHSCQQMLYKFSWQNGDESTAIDNILFVPDIVDNIMCCKFNAPPYLRSDMRKSKITSWNPEDGYAQNSSVNDIPLRVMGAGVAYSLKMELDTEIIQYYCPSTLFSVGFKVILSNPIESPKLTDGFLITPGRETMVGIEPLIKDSERRVENVELIKRSCYFLKEKYLRFFRTYTEANCRTECIANFTMKTDICKCMPLFLHYRATQTIGISKREQTSLYKDFNACWDDDSKCAKATKIFAETEAITECNCLPACYEVTYSPKSVAAAQFSRLVLSIIQKNFNGKHLQENVAIIRLFFSSDKIIKETKAVIYGFSEFLSNTGGLLGLFVGFSFLSLVEILYYLTFRFCVAKKNKLEDQHPKQEFQMKATMPAITN